MKIPDTILIAVVCVLLLAGPAYPQSREILTLQGDMIKLQNQVAQLQRSLDEKSSLLVSLVEKMADQMNLLTADIRKVNTAVAAIQSENEGTAAELRGVVRTLGDSVEQLNEGLGGIRNQVSSLSQQLNAMSSAEGIETPEELMSAAYLDFISGNYDLAISTYREFLAKYPNHPRAAEAQVQIGESHYNQMRFEDAVIEYDVLLQKFSDSDKNRTALYKKGLAQAELKQVQAAIATLNQVISKFPNTPEATGARQKVTELQRGR